MLSSYIRFKNKDASSHVEKFIHDLVDSMRMTGTDRHVSLDMILDAFFSGFLMNLDMNKKFYYIQNSNAGVLSMAKKTHKYDVYEKIYRADERLESQVDINPLDSGKNDKMLVVIHEIGRKASIFLRENCFGDAYVITAPSFVLFNNVMHNTLAFRLHFNKIPSLYKKVNSYGNNQDLGFKIDLPPDYLFINHPGF